MPYVDREKQLAAQARYYRENKQLILQVRRARRNAMRQHLEKVKSETPCEDCEIQYPHYIMDFDHVRGVKKFNVSQLSKVKSMEALLEEIAKCEVVCANCHRHRTSVRARLKSQEARQRMRWDSNPR